LGDLKQSIKVEKEESEQQAKTNAQIIEAANVTIKLQE
jgi:hypothetical protein